MAASEVAEARLIITAPFCAAELEMVGGGVGLTPPPPFPPPHPPIEAVDNRIAVSIVASAHIAKLRFRERVKERIRAGPYLASLFNASLFNYPQISGSNLSAACERDLKVITPPTVITPLADAVVSR